MCVWRYGRCQRVTRSIELQKRRFLACNEIGSIISIDQHTHAAVEIEFDDKCGCAALSTLGVTIACSVAANGPRGRYGVGWSHVYAWVAHDPFEGVAETKRESTVVLRGLVSDAVSGWVSRGFAQAAVRRAHKSIKFFDHHLFTTAALGCALGPNVGRGP